VKKQPERPVLITNAARSQGDQLRSREVRYVMMMGLRVACLIAGAILISVKPPLLPLWLILCAAGMVLLPWMAVLIANDRPAKSKAERAASQPRPAQTQRALDQEPADPAPNRTIIDADS
jgi:arginine exporter protein ArgO